MQINAGPNVGQPTKLAYRNIRWRRNPEGSPCRFHVFINAKRITEPTYPREKHQLQPVNFDTDHFYASGVWTVSPMFICQGWGTCMWSGRFTKAYIEWIYGKVGFTDVTSPSGSAPLSLASRAKDLVLHNITSDDEPNFQGFSRPADLMIKAGPSVDYSLKRWEMGQKEWGIDFYNLGINK
jgi:hypothetical protein